MAAVVVLWAPPKASAVASRPVLVAVRPSALVPPLRPAPAQLPAQASGELGRLPCLPGLGCDPLGGLGADAANAMARAVFSAFGTFVADSVATVLEQVSSAIAGTTQVTLDPTWFQQHLGVMRSLALLVLLPLVLVGLISAVVRRDAGQLWRAGGVYVPVAILGGAASVVLTERALQVTDWATWFVTGDLNGNTKQTLAALADAVKAASAAGAPGIGTFLALIVMLVLMTGALLIWIELLLRTGAIYVVVLFLPIALSGLVCRATVSWTKRMVEVLVALVLSKFVIVVVIDLAAGMITANQGVGTIMQGATLLLLAACAPFALFRLVPIVEAGAIGQLERMERRPVAAATRATTTVARQVIGGVEAAGASQVVARNGGEGDAAFSGPREPGGQLNHIQVPADGGSVAPGSGRGSDRSPTTGPIDCAPHDAVAEAAHGG